MDIFKEFETVVKIFKILMAHGVSLGSEIKDVLAVCVKIKDEIVNSLRTEQSA